MAINELHLLSEKNSLFFLGIGFIKPHLPFNVLKKYWDLYVAEEIDMSIIQRPPIFAPSFARTSSSELFDYPLFLLLKMTI